MSTIRHHVAKLFALAAAAVLALASLAVAPPVGGAEIGVAGTPSIGSGCDIEFRFFVDPPGTVALSSSIALSLGSHGDSAPDPSGLGPGSYRVSIDGTTTGGDEVEAVVVLTDGDETTVIRIEVPPCADPESIERENAYEESARQGTWIGVAAAPPPVNPTGTGPGGGGGSDGGTPPGGGDDGGGGGSPGGGGGADDGGGGESPGSGGSSGGGGGSDGGGGGGGGGDTPPDNCTRPQDCPPAGLVLCTRTARWQSAGNYDFANQTVVCPGRVAVIVHEDVQDLTQRWLSELGCQPVNVTCEVFEVEPTLTDDNTWQIDYP